LPQGLGASESALTVNVPEAEPYVGALRGRCDPAAKLGVPAHINVLYPFIPPERITHAIVRRVRDTLSSFAAFDFLSGVPAYGGHYESMVPRVGIEASCNEVVLIENSSGRWKRMHSFWLAG